MSIRQAAESDIPLICSIYVQAWHSTYRALLPETFLNAVIPISAEKIFRESFQSDLYSYFVLLVETSEGNVMGYLDGGKDRENPEKKLGEIYGLYLLEPFQGKGFGRELLKAAFDQFRRLKFTKVRTWVLREGPARSFYEREGGKIEGEPKRLVLGNDSITLVSYGWEL